MATAGKELPFKSKNKEKRHNFYIKQKSAKESAKRDARFRRKREEDKNPKLRVERRACNIPITIDRKRVWDQLDDNEGDGLGYSVDVEQFKKRKLEDAGNHIEQEDLQGLTESNLKHKDALEDHSESHGTQDSEDDLASILDGSSDDQEKATDRATDGQAADDREETEASAMPPPARTRARNPPASATSTNLSLIPEALQAKFPTLFSPPETPKILITTAFNSTIHAEAKLLTTLFPNSTYVPRQRHRYKSHHFSVREICKFASNRDYTTLLIVNEDQKRPSGLTVVHLPSGPTFHFGISNWVEGRKLPGHGNPTGHYPELILNNFRTPLGLLTAHLFRTMFPPQPELEGRQVVTLHNQRDYIFVRRHRYVFRDKRATEKEITGADGKPVKGAEEVRAGLQELGPRFTLKLRRVDKGIQRASGQEWEWKGGMEKQRTRFQL